MSLPMKSCSDLNSDPEKGLDAPGVWQRLRKNAAPTTCQKSKKQGPFMRLSVQLNNILFYVLLAAGFVKLMVNFGWTPESFWVWSSSMGCSASFRREKRRKRWIRSATCRRPKPEGLAGRGNAHGAGGDLVPGDIVLLG